MAFSSQPRVPTLPRDYVGLSRLKPRDKAFLIRQRLLELGVDAECRRLSGSVESMPPAVDFEMLFSQAPALSRLMDDSLLRVFPEHDVKLMRKNLSVINARNKMAEVEKEKEEKRRKAKELTEKLAEKTKEMEGKDKLILSKQSHLMHKNGKLGRVRDNRYSSSVGTNLNQCKHLAASNYVKNERQLETDKLKPMLERLADYDSVIANAAAVQRGDASDFEGGRSEDECRRELRLVLDAVKTSLSRQLDDVRDDNCESSSLSDVSGKTNDSLFAQAGDPFPHFDLLQKLLRGLPRESVVEAFVAEATEGSRRLKEAETSARNLDPKEASTLDCSMDDCGVIVDESARREEKELKQRRDAAQRNLQLNILQIEDEAIRMIKRSEELGKRSSNDGSSELDASLRLRVQRASQQLLKEEISRLEQVVADASGQQTILRQKRDKVEAAKDTMSLTDHMLAAVVRGTTQSRAAIEESKKAMVPFDVAVMKESAKEIQQKSTALEGSGHQALETWTATRVERMAAHRDGARGKSGAVVGGEKSSLVRDVDDFPRLDDALRSTLTETVGIPSSRHNAFHILECLVERETECRREEELLAQRPRVKSLAPLEEALQSWNVEKAIQCGADDETIDDRSGFGDVTGVGVNESRNKNNREANLAEAKRVISRVMERCVKLTEAEKTLENERGFTVLPEAKIDGKSWEEWKVVLKDAVMKYELAKK